MKAQFEEKQFEFPLALQLLSGGLPLYAPGQVLEAQLGHDFAVQTMSAAFWALWGIAPPPGAVPAPAWWPTANNLPALPTVNLNLFVQAKRAEHMIGHNAKQWGHWNQEYFRYEIESDQQTALVTCANALGQNGKVVYAAPAFYQLHDLFAHVSGGSLVGATNFVEASAMGNHTVYTFVNPGTAGAGFSDPEKIPPFDVTKDLRRAVAEAPRDTDVFRRAHHAVLMTVRRHPWFRKKLGSRWLKRTRRAAEGVGEGRSHRVALDFIRVWTYAQLVGKTWFVGGA